MKATFQITRAADGKYMFNLKSANDQIILTSQTYDNKETVEAGIASVRQNASFEDRYLEKGGTEGHPHFLLIAENQQVIGRSQMYSSRGAMRKGIASVKKNAPTAETVDFSAPVQLAEEVFRGAA